MMVEIPSNVILLGAFACYFDGFSIGSNDLTQLTLGVDRDSEIVAHEFDERDGAVDGAGRLPGVRTIPRDARYQQHVAQPDAVLSTTRIVLAAEAVNRHAPRPAVASTLLTTSRGDI